MASLSACGAACASHAGYLALERPCPQLAVDMALPSVLEGNALRIIRDGPEDEAGLPSYIASQSLAQNTGEQTADEDEDEDEDDVPQAYYMLRLTATPWEFWMSSQLTAQLTKVVAEVRHQLVFVLKGRNEGNVTVQDGIRLPSQRTPTSKSCSLRFYDRYSSFTKEAQTKNE